MSLLDLIQQQLGPQQVQQISQQVGADPATTENAVQAAIPMLLGGMAAGTREPAGASALGGLLGGGGGGLGGLLGGILGGGGAPAGGAGGGMDMGSILGSVLGRSQPAVQDGVQQASGLNSDQTRKLLMILAPIVLAAVMKGRQQRSAGGAAAGGAGGFGIPGMGGLGGATAGADPRTVDSDGDGIPDYLEQEARTAEAQAAKRNPAIGGILGKILDMAQRPPR
ncbi:DUF937 domain-containing protein [Roseisolibacter sp. H3M3-2]|uniref:DUF937 domain-containing protein n=1 Tax=Roseisolibacter sp. H3M3-2 TaxID=3031323 RepID=UPI0023DA507B|nr:DUF937 domain-containing protein [Roseisolibacter sp. H3M3-2]MDF1504369.1 DUF937 domain-containing protein [Roseisolibacter sp. H3M3-2]